MIQTIYPPHWEVQPYLDGWMCVLYENNEMSTCYRFQTSEWAMLCKQSMERHDKFLHDRKWGGSTASFVWNHQGQLTSSYHFTMNHKPIVVWDHNSQVVKFDIPALVWIWLKTSWVPKAYKRLMWGEKGKQ